MDNIAPLKTMSEIERNMLALVDFVNASVAHKDVKLFYVFDGWYVATRTTGFTRYNTFQEAFDSFKAWVG